MLPLLPERAVPWLPAVNPQKLWGLVVLFMALQGLGYIALRAAGPALGLALSGLASGFVSSTATVAAFGARARGAPALLGVSAAGALFSTVATVLLLVMVILAVNAEGLRWLGPSLAAGLVTALLAAQLNLLAGPRGAVPDIERGRAFSVPYAIGFAVTLTALTSAMTLMTGRFGALALPLSAGLAGFFDVHAAAASVLAVTKSQPVPPAQAALAILAAFSANTTSKIVAALGAGGLAYGTRVAAGLLAVLAATWTPWLLR